MLGKLPERLRKAKKILLAFEIAQGKSVSMWARQNEVPCRTAYRWASEPSVRRAVASRRRCAFDQAIGRMAKPAVWAINQIAAIANGAESESVKLRALRSIFSHMMSVSKSTDLEFRITKLEEELRDRCDSPDVSDWR